MNTDIQQTLGDIAASQPIATRVFLRHKLDFCCGGQRTLADACEKQGLDPGAIALEIASEAERGDDMQVWNTRSLGELADHIEVRYHAALRRDLPPLIRAAARVEKVHASKDKVPKGLAEHLTQLWDEMQIHMQKEEEVLFPMLRQGVRGSDVNVPIRVLHREHDEHGGNLTRIRELTWDLQIPPHACATWTALYEGLTMLEAELMHHIHLENNVLFVRATQT